VSSDGQLFVGQGFPKFIGRIILPLFVFSVVINPYTIWGNPGYLVSFFLIVFSILSGAYRVGLEKNVGVFSLLLAIGAWGAIQSFVHGIFQVNHIWSVISLFFTFFCAQGLYVYCKKCAVSFHGLLLVIYSVIVFNSFVISLEVVFPDFRDLVESGLLPSGNRDWSEGPRYRGLASGGGATLSLLTPVAFSISLYLLSIGRLGVVAFSVTSIIILFATSVIGRTGLLLLPIVFLFYVFQFSNRFIVSPKSLFKPVVLSAFLIMTGLLLFEYLVIFLSDRFDSGFVDYAFGFLFEGPPGIKREGTVGVIVEYLSVVPTKLPEVLTGYGFYGGSEFSPWTDSGYSRMWLSVGFVLGAVFYLGLIFLFFEAFRSKKMLVVPIAIVLLVAEAKEPALFSGNAARALVLILVFLIMDSHFYEAKCSRTQV